ncbi:MAG: hypothetical protein KME42_07480 [Tildeniella nuda ZEHNDER 1965/U140]|nr:hypothetical protein [Tildeniella nuda ZEHNDER 1965/U140]
MTPEELKHQIERLKQNDPDEREDILYTLAKAGSGEAIEAMLATLDELEQELSLYEAAAIVFQILPLPAIGLPPLIAYLDKSPLSTAGRECAYILGDIASYYPKWHQGENPDSRILPALLRAAETALQNQSFRAFGMCLYALRECVRYGSIPEAERLLRSALLLMDQGDTLDEMGELALYHLLEILYVNAKDKEGFFIELKAMLAKLQSEHDFAACLEEFLDKKRQGDVWW